MREKVNQEVSVVMYFSARRRVALPHLISWQNKEYAVGEIGYRHTVWEGKTLHHIFELVDKESTIAMRLRFDTSNLHWTLETVHDGNTL